MFTVLTTLHDAKYSMPL